MSLTQEQEIYIANAFLPRLTLPQHSHVFVLAIEKLRAAISSRVPHNHPYARLSTCFFDPISLLPELDKLNDEPTYLGDVQRYIISLLTDVIEEHVAYSLIITPYAWNKEKLEQQYIPPINDITRVMQPIESIQPINGCKKSWPLELPQERNFSIMLHLIQSDILPVQDPFNISLDDANNPSVNRELHVEIQVRLQNTNVHTSSHYVCTLPPTFASEQNEDSDEFIQENQDLAEKIAKREATIALLRLLPPKLKSRFLSDDNELIKTASKPGVQELLSIPYYYERICERNSEKRLPFNSLVKLTKEESTVLSNPSMIALLKTKKLTFNKVKTLSEIAKRVMSHPTYYSLYMNQKISFDWLTRLSRKQVKFLLDPLVAQLISQDKLDFRTAISLHDSIHAIFYHDGYRQFLLDNPVDDKILLQLKDYHCRLLQHTRVIADIQDKRTQFADIAELTQTDAICWRLINLYLTGSQPKVDSRELIFTEMAETEIPADQVMSFITKQFVQFVALSANKFDPVFVARFNEIVAKCPNDQASHISLVTDLCDLANDTIRASNKSRILASVPAADTSTLFSSTKRKRTADNLEQPSAKRPKTEAHETEGLTTALCGQIKQLSEIVDYFNHPVMREKTQTQFYRARK